LLFFCFKAHTQLVVKRLCCRSNNPPGGTVRYRLFRFTERPIRYIVNSPDRLYRFGDREALILQKPDYVLGRTALRLQLGRLLNDVVHRFRLQRTDHGVVMQDLVFDIIRDSWQGPQCPQVDGASSGYLPQAGRPVPSPGPGWNGWAGEARARGAWEGGIVAWQAPAAFLE
jgi:hypothetical protein